MIFIFHQSATDTEHHHAPPTNR